MRQIEERKGKKRHNVTLAARRLTSPHTAANVASLVNAVLAEWQIPETMVHRILTDNGSNMLASFRQQHNNDDEVELICDDDMNENESQDEDAVDVSRLQDELDNFEECEQSHRVAFMFTSCFSHTLQLVVNELKSRKALLTKVQKLVAKVNKSHKATEMLIAKAGRKLIADCPTRWSSTYLMLNRLLLVKDELAIVLNDLQWDNLPTSYWKQIENTNELLKPFAQYTQLMGSEEVTTISMIIPALMELDM